MKLLTVTEFCAMLRMSHARECRWRKQGVIPRELYKVIYRGKRKDSVIYIEERVEAWVLGETELRRVKHAEASIRQRRHKSMSRGNNMATQNKVNGQSIEQQKENSDSHLTTCHADRSLERAE